MRVQRDDEFVDNVFVPKRRMISPHSHLQMFCPAYREGVFGKPFNTTERRNSTAGRARMQGAAWRENT